MEEESVALVKRKKKSCHIPHDLIWFRKLSSVSFERLTSVAQGEEQHNSTTWLDLPKQSQQHHLGIVGGGIEEEGRDRRGFTFRICFSERSSHHEEGHQAAAKQGRNEQSEEGRSAG